MKIASGFHDTLQFVLELYSSTALERSYDGKETATARVSGTAHSVDRSACERVVADRSNHRTSQRAALPVRILYVLCAASLLAAVRVSCAQR